MRLLRFVVRLGGAWLLLLSLATGAPPAITGLILTWRQDPTTTQVIDWHQNDPESGTALAFSYRAAPAAGASAETPWTRAEPDPARDFPYTSTKIFRVELTGLQPDTRYEFRIGDAPPRAFRTLPATLVHPLRIAVGGDLMHGQGELFEAMNRVVATWEPALVVWGGDLAYENGAADQAARMQLFLDIMGRSLVTADGRVIPVVVTAGNHEVVGGYYSKTASAQAGQWHATAEARAEIAPYYCALWAFPGHPGYGALDLGDYASLLLLDTDHTAPIEGAQTAWLAEALHTRAGRTHLLPVYHVPAYPSVRSFDGSVSRKVRQHWLPLFDHAGIRLAFENHDHIYKRTPPLRGGRQDPGGVTYVGDGAWGVKTREPRGDAPYLEKLASENHAILVTMQRDRLDLEVRSITGHTLDRFSIPARR